MTAAVELTSVTKRYGAVEAVRGLTFAIPEGALFGLIGPNGAGKTTTFNLLSGLVRPSSGEIRVRDRVLGAGRPPVGQVLALPQDALLPARDSVRKCLVRLGRLGGMPASVARQRSDDAIERVGLSAMAHKPVGNLSHGQRRRVGIASALVGHEEVIVLDEPTAGLDPRTALELRALIQALNADRTVVLSSHDLSEVETLCTHAAILDRGRLVVIGTMDEVKGAGQRLYIRLSRAPESADPMTTAIRAMDSVKATEWDARTATVLVEVTDASQLDAVTTEVLLYLLGAGHAIKGLERGQRLADRFMETTGR